MKLQFITVAIALFTGSVLLTSCDPSDITSPVISIKDGDTRTHVLNATFVMPKVTATDDEDGDLSSSVTYTGGVNKDSVGVYRIIFRVEDMAGNVAKDTLTVTVENSAHELEGNYSVTETFDGATITPYNQQITVSKSINNRVFINKFRNMTNGKVYATVSGSSFTIPEQTVVCGSPSLSRTIVSTQGSISGSQITYTYNETTTASPVAGNAVLVKQP